MDYEVKISPSAVREDLGEGTGLERTGAHEPAVRRSASYRTLTHRGEDREGFRHLWRSCSSDLCFNDHNSDHHNQSTSRLSL